MTSCLEYDGSSSRDDNLLRSVHAPSVSPLGTGRELMNDYLHTSRESNEMQCAEGEGNEITDRSTNVLKFERLFIHVRIAANQSRPVINILVRAPWHLKSVNCAKFTHFALMPSNLC